MKKLLVVGVIILFLGLACAPSINADISKESELIEITTEICGLGGGKQTVQLTKEEADEVEQLIDDIERRLDAVETKEEFVEIFNKAIVELDKHGLFGGLNFKQVKKFFYNNYLKFINIFNRYNNKISNNNYLDNLFCLILVNYKGIPQNLDLLSLVLYLLYVFHDIFPDIIPPILFVMLFFIPAGYELLRVFHPFSVQIDGEKGSFYSNGLYGIVQDVDKEVYIYGFVGLKIVYRLFPYRVLFLGWSIGIEAM